MVRSTHHVMSALDIHLGNATETRPSAGLFEHVRLRTFKCDGCEATQDTPMMMCPCGQVQYHSEECQAQDWPEHEQACSAKKR